MSKAITEYELLISCPGDVTKEVDIIHEVVQQFNSQFSRTLEIRIQERHWEKDAYPASGHSPQDVLNKQFVLECDAAVAIFWTRFGTPTDEYGSGTEEEIEKMIANNKQVFMYFSDAAMSPSKLDNEQYRKIQEFRNKYKDKGLYWTYSSTDEFKEIFYAHLTQYFLSLSKVTAIENDKKPDLKIDLVDGETNELIDNTYEYEYPCSLITLKELSEADIYDEIARYVTIDDIKEYNENLPSKEDVEKYNKQQTLYENAQNNSYTFKLLLENVGSSKANDIYVDLYCPKEILAYDEFDVERIKKPEVKPSMPVNPVWKAVEAVERQKTKDFMVGIFGPDATSKILQQDRILSKINSGTPMESFLSGLHISNPINMYNYDYSIENCSKLTLHIKNLLHTRQYTSDKFYLIFTSSGEFEIKYSIMCEEWIGSIDGKFIINVENK